MQRDILAAEADIARVQQTLRWTDVRLTINDLLPTYSQVKSLVQRTRRLACCPPRGTNRKLKK